jgi:hypothetical protein
VQWSVNAFFITSTAQVCQSRGAAKRARHSRVEVRQRTCALSREAALVPRAAVAPEGVARGANCVRQRCGGGIQRQRGDINLVNLVSVIP